MDTQHAYQGRSVPMEVTGGHCSNRDTRPARSVTALVQEWQDETMIQYHISATMTYMM